jgi:hypothetical protein
MLYRLYELWQILYERILSAKENSTSAEMKWKAKDSTSTDSYTRYVALSLLRFLPYIISNHISTCIFQFNQQDSAFLIFSTVLFLLGLWMHYIICSMDLPKMLSLKMNVEQFLGTSLMCYSH